MRQHSYSLLALLLGVLALGLGVVACDSSNPIAPSGSSLTVTANPTTIGLNQVSTITVTGFKPDGNPLNPGSQITLSTDLGALDATVLSIDNNGRATTVLRPDGRTGPATVTASLPAAESMAMAAVQIGESVETKPTLSVVVSPNTIALGETATVSAIARNADGSSLGAGGQVRLRTDLGTLDAENLVTDSNGEASTILNAGDTPGTASIVGSVDASDETMAVTVTIGETSETRPTLSLTVSPSTLGLGEVATVEVQARNADGSLYGQGGDVRLTTDLGTLARTNLTTNSNGEASTVLTAGDTPGTATVTGAVDSSDEVTASVTIENQKPTLIINANPDNVAVQRTSLITIVARDNNGIPLGAGERVQLFASLGSIPAFADTNSNGRAEAIFDSGVQAGTATIQAILGTSDVVTVQVAIRDAVKEVILAANPTTIERPATNADATPITLTATIRNAQGEPLSNILVTFNSPEVGGEFTTTAGTSSNGTVQTGGDGVAEIVLTATATGIDTRTTFSLEAIVVSEGDTFTEVVNITVNN